MENLYSLQNLNKDWCNCTRCLLGPHARKHILYEIIDLCYQDCYGRGEITLPHQTDPVTVDIMIIGEGPGVSEQAIGRPFVGPAGQLLRKCLQKAMYKEHPGATICLTNLLACRPFEGLPTGTANRAPTSDEVMACLPRLVSLIKTLNPAMIVAAGNVPNEYLQELVQSINYAGEYEQIRHPAWVIRQSDKALAELSYVDVWRSLLRRSWEVQLHGC